MESRIPETERVIGGLTERRKKEVGKVRSRVLEEGIWSGTVKVNVNSTFLQLLQL